MEQIEKRISYLYREIQRRKRAAEIDNEDYSIHIEEIEEKIKELKNQLEEEN